MIPMRSTWAVTLLLALPLGVSGTWCNTGYKPKTNHVCTLSALTSPSCQGSCCSLDITKCAHFANAGTISCAAGTYYDATVSAGVSATTANKNTACCTSKALCTDTSVTCSVAYKKKCYGTLIGLYCATSATDATSCNANCCEQDAATCLYIGGISCAANYYLDATKNGAAATASNKNSICCTAKAECSVGACLTGWKKKEFNYCTSSTPHTNAACNSNCCELDTTKCGGINQVACTASNSYWDTAKASTIVSSSGAGADCCSPRATCNSHSCQAGYKQKSNAQSIYCSTNALSCNTGTCCDINPATCLGTQQVACVSGGNYYWDSVKAGTVFTTGNQGTECCTLKTTCAGYQCSAGYILKSTASSIYCSTNSVSSCVLSTCCDLDATRCGPTAITCLTPTTHYWDSAKAGSTFTTGQKNVDCCTAKATCVVGTCAAGTKKKEPNYCATSATTLASCDATCCEADTTKCGGIAVGTCATANTYWDSNKYNTVFTPGSQLTECCTTKANCGNYGCTAGYKLKTTPQSIFCTKDSTTCITGTCCDLDPTKCGGLAQGSKVCAQPSTHYWDSAKDGTTFTTGNQATECCTIRATCTSFSCGSGYQPKANAGLIYCTTVSTTCNRATCCDAITTQCGGTTQVACANPNTHFWDAAKASTTFGTANVDCCTAKATCCGYSCSAGSKLKTDADLIYCPGIDTSTSCTQSICCVSDATRCGGTTQVACANPTTHYWDPAKVGTIFTTASIDCCTARAGCYSSTSAVCSAGRKFKMLYCTSSATTSSSCAACCEADTTKCGGTAQVTCASSTTHIWDVSKAGTTFTTKNIDCCTALATCSAMSSSLCSAGYKKKMVYCDSSLTTAAACNTNCCEHDTTTCKFIGGINCVANSYHDSSTDGTAATSANKNTVCCTSYAECSASVACNAGYKLREFNYCLTGASTQAACNQDCCEADTTTCKFIGGITCATGTYYDTAKDSTVVTSSNKNSNCCTAKAACSAGTCSPGYKKKCPLTGMYCNSALTTASSCNANCCKPDSTKCGGITQIACTSGLSYWDTAKYGTTFTAGSEATDCCTTKATCSGYVCAAGYTTKTNAASTYCASTSSTCDSPTCCDAVNTMCGGTTQVPCANTITHYWDSAKAGTTWTTKNIDCCTAFATCDAGACQAGQKKKEYNYCSSSAMTSGACANCCEPDTTKCGGQSQQVCNWGGSTTGGTHYWDPLKAGNTFTSAAADCCTLRANCGTFVCPAAHNLKPNAQTIYCTTTSSTCDTATCCNADTTKCGGVTQITCTHANYYWDSTKATTTFSNRFVDCCTLKASCTGYQCAAGYTLRSNPNTVYCAGTSYTCNTQTCCVGNPITCAGTTQATCSAANSYWDQAKAGVVFATAAIDCCTTKATCCGYACGAGYKSKSNAGSIHCTGDSTTCTSGTCCDLDTTKCGGTTQVACANPTTHFWDSAKAGTTFATRNIDCCTARTACSAIASSVCQAGYKKKTQYCSTSATTAASCAACCEDDPLKCGTTQITCASPISQYWDSAKAGTAFATKNIDCCSARTACSATSSSVCSPGYKKKTHYCSSSATTALSCNQNCCETDTTTCKFIGGISCASNYYQDSAKDSTQATAANKNTVCCTAKALCSAYTCPSGYTGIVTHCTSSATDPASCSANCCEQNSAACKYIGGIICASGYYHDSAKDGTIATSATKNTVCCSAKTACTATGVTCWPGYVKKCSYNLVGLHCTSSAMTAAVCNSNCCEADPTSCRFITGIACASGYYQDFAKHAVTATAATKNTVCCTPKVQCSAGSCNLGWKKREFNYCTSSTATTATCTDCCEPDITKCGGTSAVSCTYAFQYWDTTKAGTIFTTPGIDCCSLQSTCTGYQCPVGYNLKANPASVYCTKAASTCDRNTCCDADSTKCAGTVVVACTNQNSYWDSSKAGVTFSNAATDCCSYKASCNGYQCQAGYKATTLQGTVAYCVGDFSTCDQPTCCDVDLTKCGGITQVPCTYASQFWDSSKAGTTFTTAAVDCCSTKATCVAGTCYAWQTKKEPNYCSSAATTTTSCASCCEVDTTKCGGLPTLSTCTDPNSYWDSVKASLVYTAGNSATDCCTPKAICDGYQCSVGYRLKLNAASIYCTTDSTSCNQNTCCEADTLKCGGTTLVACTNPNHYWDTAKAGTVFTTGNQATECCTIKATCTGHGCAAGYNLKSSPANIYCYGASSTCDDTTCCNADSLKCGGTNAITCAVANHYWDTLKAGFSYGTKNIDCCTAKATCCGHGCASGYKLKANTDTIYCTGASSSCNDATCCELDTTKCGGTHSVACANPTTHFWDPAKANTVFTTKNVDCCTAKVACYSTPSTVCAAGFKKKMQYCASTATTAATCQNCCENDASKCGTTAVACASPTTHYWDSSKASVSFTTKNVDCCTAKATCSATPASVCQAGYKKKLHYCSYQATTAAACNTNCCEQDLTKCKYIGGITCATGYYLDSTKDNTTATSATKNTACCTAYALCSAGTCGAGKKRQEFNYCTSSATTSAACNTDCCEQDTATCKHITGVNCGTGYYKDTAKDGMAATTQNMNTVCCTAKASCTTGTCSSGYKKKCDLGGLYCTSSLTTAAACNADCCIQDTTKCGSVNAAACTNTNTYLDPSKYGTTFTAGNQATDCCTLRANCGGYQCPAGFKSKTNPTTIYCTQTSTTCDQPTCCDNDPTKCGTTAVTCQTPTTHYWDTAKAGTTFTTARNIDCCTHKVACSTTAASVCSPGYKKKEPYYCTSNVETTTTCANCCEPDPTKCGGTSHLQNVVACSTTLQYWDSTKAGLQFSYPPGTSLPAGITGSAPIDCCTARATCAGYQCQTVYKKLKSNPSVIYCTTNSASCVDATCCDDDTTKCGGINPVACTSGNNYYWDSSKAGTTHTGSTPGAVCCSTKATCSGYGCPSGYTPKASTASIYCTGAFASCSSSTCCDPVATKCGGTSQVACNANYYWDSAKAAVTFTSKVTDCCTAKATCCAYTCGAGFRLKANAFTIYCTDTSASCTSNTCCEVDSTKCGTTLIACATPSTHFWDSAKAGTTFTTANVDCCTARKACSTTSASACLVGYKKKEANYCTSSTASTSTCQNCCEKDATKCGGLTTVSCLYANYYYDSAKADTTFSTANVDCCTARMACSATPASVCLSGYKKKVHYCSLSTTTAASCDANCCVSDPAKCGGIGGITCAANHYVDSAKSDVAATAATKNTVCCTARAPCPPPSTWNNPTPPVSPTPTPSPPSTSPTPPPSTITTTTTTTVCSNCTSTTLPPAVQTAAAVQSGQPTLLLVIAACLVATKLWR